MIGDKEERFQGKGTDLSALQAHIEEYLKNEGFKTQTSAPSTQGAVIQAHKGGFLAGLIAADRALTIATTGSPDDFTVHVGIGKWLEHLAVTAVETLLVSELFIIVDVPEMAWNLEIENKLMTDIRSFIEGPSEAESGHSGEPAASIGSAESAGSPQQSGSMSAGSAGSSGSLSAPPAESGSPGSMSAPPAEPPAS